MLEHFIEVFIASVQVGHIGYFLSVHHSFDSIRALSAGIVVVQEAYGITMSRYIGSCLFQVGNGIQYNNVAAGLHGGLHNLPGEEVKETFENRDVRRLGFYRNISLRIDGGYPGLGSTFKGPDW